jgi:peptide/nickel transport system ATP-binding protein
MRSTKYSTPDSEVEPYLSLLEVSDLSVSFKIEAGLVHAVDGVSLSLDKGEILGLAGESGSGKSTFGYSLIRVLPKTAVVNGKIVFDGVELLELRDDAMRQIRGKRIAMVFQGSMNSLNPLVRVEEQIAEPLVLHLKLDERKALEHARELLSQVGVEPEKGRSYPHELSGGLKQRVAIAMALSTNPDLLIADEPTTALDVMTQAQIMGLMRSLRDKFGISIIVISHDLALLSEVADRIALMYAGKIVEVGETLAVVRNASHPYTRALLASIPSVENVGKESGSIPGDPPDPLNPLNGCRFRPRCRLAMQGCELFDNAPRHVDSNHYAACILVGGKAN